jgi:hypothetical protein
LVFRFGKMTWVIHTPQASPPLWIPFETWQSIKKPSKETRSKGEIWGVWMLVSFSQNGSVVEYCRADELGTYTHTQ